ncbi:hemagglutination activity domain protein [Geobacter sp. OR-1]|uniref:beta strand repeat-containing protein n=1 Tax=Geobacter sp. OR-1 TaxID=1266765 RepID=UPI000542B866|nr:filamentous hemagglutinin N-terminal domain-containing protein [Geobacter sp. OR-1]GAM09457.1 hemagglutination activity domain protein [Geobacter sp. OR-1]
MSANGFRKASIIAFFLLLPTIITLKFAVAGIVTDGSMGRSTPLTGPNYAITADLGRQHGGNLFHSFSQFNLVKNDIATFSGPASVTNIISRVTGGSASSIDGTIRSTIPGANLYIVNPSGIMFGPNASLDVTGSFHATTADYLKLGIDGRFDARNPQASLLTSAPPSAFGFVTTTPAPITVTDSLLGVLEGQTLSLIGGDLTLTNSVDYSLLWAPGGGVNLAAVGSSGELALTTSGIDVSNFNKMGAISIIRTATDRNYYDIATNSDRSGGGSIFISGGQFFADNAWIASNTEGSDGGKDIVITASELVELKNNTAVYSNTYSGSIGGSIFIASPLVVLDSSSLGSFAYGSGNAGNIRINGESVSLIGKADISSGTFSVGYGGSLSIKAKDYVLLSEGSVISVSSEAGTGNAGTAFIETTELYVDGSEARILGETKSEGVGGSLVIKSSDFVNLTRGGRISVSATGKGDSGTASIETDKLNVFGNFLYLSGISSETSSVGKGGTLSIKATDSVNLTNGGFISVATTGKGNAGTASIETGNLSIGMFSKISSESRSQGDGGTLSINSAGSISLSYEGTVFSSAYAAGKGGDLAVKTADSITLANGGQINVSAETGTGNAGTTTIETSQLNVNGRFINSSSIFCGTSSEGKGGDLSIKAADSVNLTNGGTISVSAVGSSGNAGTAKIETSSLNIDGDGSNIFGNTLSNGVGGSLLIKASDSINLINGGGIAVSANAGSGNAGNAAIEATRLNIDGYGSGIKACTSTSGKGGDLSIKTSDSVNVTNMGDISVIANAGSGNAGVATIETATLNLDGFGSLSAFTWSSGMGGFLSVKASNAVNLTNMGAITVSTSDGSGNAGSVSIETTNLNVDRSIISGTTYATGDGGSLLIKAHNSINLANGGKIYVAASAGSGKSGSASIGSARLNVDGVNSSISCVTKSEGDGGTLSIKAADSITLKNEGSIYSSADKGSGNAGNATIETTTLTIDSDALITAGTATSGRGGNLTIKASDSMTLTNGGMLTVSALKGSSGNSGTATIETARLNLDGTSLIMGSTFSSGTGGTLSIKASDSINLTNESSIDVSAISGSGAAGFATIETGNLNVGSRSVISGATLTSGKGANLIIRALDSINLNGGGKLFVSAAEGSGDGGTASIETTRLNLDNAAINGDTWSAGKGGTLSIRASDSVNMSNGANISVSNSAESTGAPGAVTLETRRLNVDGKGTYISSITFTGSTGGALAIKAAEFVNLTNGGVISTQAAAGSGDGGTAIIEAAQLKVAGASRITGTTLSAGKGGTLKVNVSDMALITDNASIIASAAAGSSGEGGDIHLTAGKLIIGNNGAIASESNGTGRAGDINIVAGSQVTMDNSSITTATVNADGGNIFIDPRLVDLRNSRITTSVNGGTGNGGNIDLAARNLVLDQSSIIANAEGGNGGNINLDTPSLIKSQTGSVISASSRLGLQGTILISSPIADLGATLADMPDTIIDISSLAPKRCASRDEEISSFTVQESAGAAPNPDRPIVTQ